MNIAAFIDKHGVTSSADKVIKNPFLTDDIPWDATHWLVSLTCGSRTLETFFSNGGAYKAAPPKTEDVLFRLLDISATIGNAQTFEAWAQKLGYDETSPISEKRYKQYKKQVFEFKVFLGDSAYEDLTSGIDL